MLVTSIFSFSHNVFKRFLSQGREKLKLCGKELNITSIFDKTTEALQVLWKFKIQIKYFVEMTKYNEISAFQGNFMADKAMNNVFTSFVDERIHV